MMKCLLNSRAITALLIAMFMSVGTAMVAGDSQLNKKLEAAIAKVRSAESPGTRSNAAEELVNQMVGIDPESVDLKTEADLVSLLHDPDLDVRSLMTVALGQLGRRAKIADAALNNKIEEAIAKVRAGKSLDARCRAAFDLFEPLRGNDPMYVDDKTVADMISLLNAPDDCVRGEAAAFLGVMGPRAKAAVPKLLAILPEADCERAKAYTGITAADAIRPALERMGVSPPPFNPKGCK